MYEEISISLTPKVASEEKFYKKEIAKQLSVYEKDITGIEILKRSIDARKKYIKIVMRVKVWLYKPAPKKEKPVFNFKNVSDKPEIIIVGSGPAGLFAALKFIEKGLRPIILERGKPVGERKLDIAAINRNLKINPNSNYCFGEGGAGTFSDGKLYTRSKKRGNIKRILSLLIFHGASEKILSNAHPHIGTNHLPKIIKNIRKTILQFGGKILFNSKVTDIIIKNNTACGVVTEQGDKIFGKSVILATGHSAEDIYELLHRKNIKIEAKNFAMGVRVEHSQSLINSIQYHYKFGNKYLPAAKYNLATQVNGRGVYSFCMCPGGYIVPAVTGDNEIVVNGMSPSKRNSEFANSGIVVETKIEDFPEYEKYKELAGLKFRQQIEKSAFLNGGSGLIAPAQKLIDFTKNRLSNNLPENSYHPGIISSPLHFWLPENISKRLQTAFKIFGKKMRGFLSSEAVAIGVETRTSSPVRIPRNKQSFEHEQISGLYPCGEGAGYSGGIISSAIDGEICADKISENF